MGGLSKGSACLLTMMPAATTLGGCGAWGATKGSCSLGDRQQQQQQQKEWRGCEQQNYSSDASQSASDAQ